MSQINVYADETCHVGTHSDTMVLGAVWCSADEVKALNEKVKLIKMRHGVASRREIKWTKVSQAKLDYYKELVDFFMNESQLCFRGIVIPKNELDHQRFDQSQDDFYYKMMFLMLKNIAQKAPVNLKIYLDYKDTWSNKRAKSLAQYLNNTADLHGKEYEAQPVRSYESAALQLADLLIGAVAYKRRYPGNSTAKAELVRYIEEVVGQDLSSQTPFGVNKFNLFFWEPQR